ncbi:MAG: 2'-5' RNA ligase family protein [Chitinophagaceae bacterium]|jgi:hypothetical protein|nr:2'-5' RNA ligase family protein [Chitinophagaceae bacterium]
MVQPAIKQQVFKGSASGVGCAYRLILPLPEGIENEAGNGVLPEITKPSINGPNVLLGTFSAAERMEDTLLRWLFRISGNHEPIELILNNFGSLPPVWVYLRIQEVAPLRKLADAIRAIDPYLTGNAHKPFLPAGRWQVPMFGHLPVTQQMRLSELFARQEYHKKINLTLLQLEKQESGKWQRCGMFPLVQGF